MTAVTGLDEILRNLNGVVAEIEGDTRKGLQAAGLFIKGKAKEITPVQFGPLRRSAFFSTDVISSGSRLRVGYTQSYAPFVHEMPDSTNWSSPGTGNKFLEKAVKNNVPEIIQIIANRARV